MSVLGILCGELKMNVNLLEPENKSFMGRKISNVNFPLNPEVGEWLRLNSDTIKTCHRIWESGRHSWSGEEKPEQGNTIRSLFLLLPFALLLLLSARGCPKVYLARETPVLRVWSFQPFILMTIYLSPQIL